MFLAKVIGNVVATQKSPEFNGMTLLLVQPYINKDKVLVASGCLPQRYSKELEKEMPEVATYLRHHNEGSVEVIGIDSHDTRGPAMAFDEKSGVAFRVVFDPNLKVANIFNLAAIPDTAFVNAKGVVTQIYSGAIPASQLAKGIANLRAS